MSETHDPWDYLAEFIEGNAVRPPGGQQAGSPMYPLVPSVARELRQLVVAGRAARAAEATQHQQELIDLRANYAQSMRLSNETLADTLARLAAVEAERDAALKMAEANAQTAEHLSCVNVKLREENNVLLAAARELRAERDNQYTQAVEATQRALLAEQALANVEAERDQLTLRRHDAACELRGPGGAVERRCSCGFRAVKVEVAALRAERDRLKAALSQITALDFEKVNGRHNFYSGAAMFVKAWLLAYAAISGEGTK